MHTVTQTSTHTHTHLTRAFVFMCQLDMNRYNNIYVVCKPHDDDYDNVVGNGDETERLLRARAHSSLERTTAPQLYFADDAMSSHNETTPIPPSLPAQQRHCMRHSRRPVLACARIAIEHTRKQNPVRRIALRCRLAATPLRNGVGWVVNVQHYDRSQQTPRVVHGPKVFVRSEL